MTKMKDVKKSTHSTTPLSDFYMTILNLLKQGMYPHRIAKELGVTRQKINYYISLLKRSRIIEKIGYGVWKVRDYKDLKDVKKSRQVTPTCKTFNSLPTTDKVRGHAFMFNLKIPKLSHWSSRQNILDKKKIPYIGINNNITQRIIFRNHKIWLNTNTITIFWPSFKNYLSDTAKESYNHAIYDLQQLIRGLERLLGASFQINRQYVFKVCRQHYSLVKNALAKQYDKEKKKLNCYTEEGLWFSIDNSYNLHEAETLHHVSAISDSKKVQNFFNSLKKTPLTTDFILQTMNGIQQNQVMFSKNMESHVKAIQDLSKGVGKWNEKIDKLMEKLK